jgi:carboxymethylenebutenolidase
MDKISRIEEAPDGYDLAGRNRGISSLRDVKKQIRKQIMEEREKSETETSLTPAQQNLEQLWEEHVRHEFNTHNTEETLATMVEDAYVNHIPVLTGGVGKDELREFYSKRFIPQMPPDTEMIAISRTIGDDQLVDEMVFKFTHTISMDWMLPGIAPTGKRVEVPLVAIVRFREGKLAHEHIYWDQASVLVQLGLLDAANLPVVGVESARKALDPSIPSNALIRRAEQSK